MNTGKLLIARTAEGVLEIVAEAEKASQLLSLIDTPEFEKYDIDSFAIVSGFVTVHYNAATRRRELRKIAATEAAEAKAKADKADAVKAAKESKKAPKKASAKSLEDALND